MIATVEADGLIGLFSTVALMAKPEARLMRTSFPRCFALQGKQQLKKERKKTQPYNPQPDLSTQQQVSVYCRSYGLVAFVIPVSCDLSALAHLSPPWATRSKMTAH